MPTKAPRVCIRCKRTTTSKTGICEACDTGPSDWSRSQKGKTTTQRGYGHRWRQRRNRILERDNHLCVPCAKRGIYSHASDVDHIINKKSGGTDDDSNLQAICRTCHDEKTKKEALNARKSKGTGVGFSQIRRIK